MSHQHPDAQALQRFVAGQLSQRQNLKLAWHLFNCASCRRWAAGSRPGRRLVADLFRGLRPVDGVVVLPTVDDRSGYDQAISRTYDFLLAREADLDWERSCAPDLFAELAGHPPGRQHVLVANTRRFQTWGLAEYLLERSAAACLEEPARAQEIADLACMVAERLSASAYSAALLEDLRGRCWSHIANARRVVADLAGAEEAFERAERHLEQGTEDPMEWARLRSVKASLRRDQRRFAEAEDLLHRAAAAHRRLGEPHELGKVLFSLSLVYVHQGDPGQALETLQKAVALIDDRRDPHLTLAARYNLIDYLAEAGRFMEAQALLARTRALFQQHANRPLRLRLPWVKGKIAFGLGQLAQAEAAYRAARKGFQEAGDGVDAALVGLELAMVCARQGRTAEVKELALETLATFEALDVAREALAAALVLRRAAEAEQVSVALLRELTAKMRRSLETSSV